MAKTNTSSILDMKTDSPTSLHFLERIKKRVARAKILISSHVFRLGISPSHIRLSPDSAISLTQPNPVTISSVTNPSQMATLYHCPNRHQHQNQHHLQQGELGIIEKLQNIAQQIEIQVRMIRPLVHLHSDKFWQHCRLGTLGYCCTASPWKSYRGRQGWSSTWL